MAENSLLKHEELINSSLASNGSTNEKELVSNFISSLLKEEKEKQDKKKADDFIGSLFEIAGSNTKTKKINNQAPKNKVIKENFPSNKKVKNKENNKNKKSNMNDKNIIQDKTMNNNIYRNSLIKKILIINEHQHNYERNKSIEIRPKYINDENVLIKKTNARNNSTKKRIINRLNNKNSKEIKNKTFNYSDEKDSGQKLKEKLNSDKERKECEEKILLLKNHISAIKRQQDNMNKRIIFLKNKENMINNVKKMKEKSKRDFDEYKINEIAELEQKRKNIEKQREEMNKGIKESKQKNILEKSRGYKLYQKERKEEKKENEKNTKKKIIEHMEKIKAIREINKNNEINRKKNLNKTYNDINEKKYENNIKKTKLLKEQIKQLSKEEDECLVNLNRIKNKLNIMISLDRYSSNGHEINKRIHKPKTVTSFNLDKE